MANIEEDLLEANRGLVKSIVKHFRPKNSIEFEEYEQAGLIGLFKAIRRHDPLRGKLSTIAFYYIKGEIQKFIKKEKEYHNIGVDSCNYYYNNFHIDDYLACLSETERSIIDMRLEGASFKEIGDRFGVNRVKASHIYSSIIKKVADYNG